MIARAPLPFNCSVYCSPSRPSFGAPTQLLQVVPCLQPDADVVQAALTVLGRPVLGRPRYASSPSILENSDIAWFVGASSSDVAEEVPSHTTSRCLSSVASDSRRCSG